MVRYLLVRHAEASSRGPDAPLTREGEVQAEALARRLRGWPFAAAWSSDLSRAEQTARAILAGRESLPLRVSPALREVEIPPEVAASGAGSDLYRAWEERATAELAGRLSGWLRGVEGGEGLSEPTVLVVSHAGPLRVLLCLLLGLPPEMHWRFRLDHAGLTVVSRGDDMGTISLLNDRCHLGEPKAEGAGRGG